MNFFSKLTTKLSILSNRAFGNIGEDIAESFLKEQGYRIIERNYNTRRGEIDIIAGKDEIIAFIEVKTRSTTDYGRPEEAVTPKKKRSISRAAYYYISSHNNLKTSFRADIISIILSETHKPEITHIINAFELKQR